MFETHYKGQLGQGANSSGGLEGPNIEMCTGLAVGSAGDHPATTGQPQEPGEFSVTKLNYNRLFKRGLERGEAKSGLELQTRTGLGGAVGGATETLENLKKNLRTLMDKRFQDSLKA